MGPENGFDPNGYTVYLGDTPIARGEIKLKEITIPVEMFEPVRGLVCQCEDARQWMGFTLKIEVPKRWRCRSRNGATNAQNVNSNGSWNNNNCSNTYGIRPALMDREN